MEGYRHHVSAFFARHEEADAALRRLVSRGLPRERLHIFAPRRGSSAVTTSSSETDESLMVSGGAIRIGMGALAEVGLVMANVSLFIATPVVAALTALGWGATLAGLSEGTPQSINRESWFSELIRDTISAGQVVLVADTWTPYETEMAQHVLQSAVRATG